MNHDDETAVVIESDIIVSVEQAKITSIFLANKGFEIKYSLSNKRTSLIRL